MSDMGGPEPKRKRDWSTWFEAWLRVRHGDITIHHQDTGIAWAGFWIGLGLVIAAAVWKGQIVIK